MKTIFRNLAALIAFASAAAGAATLSPVQLLNPAGSTAGQAVVSTGPSSAPAWGTVTAGTLSPVAANTAIANVTSSTASPAAFPMPSCSTTTSALQYTTNTGFTCFTGSAPLASPTFTGTVTTSALTATGAITPSQTAGIVGTTTNNNANAGSVGEFVFSNVPATSPVALTSGVAANITSISLTAGDWQVCGNIVVNPAATTTQAYFIGSINTTSATQAVSPNGGAYAQISSAVPAGLATAAYVGCMRQLITTTTTFYLVVTSSFSVSTAGGYGYLSGRRMR